MAFKKLMHLLRMLGVVIMGIAVGHNNNAEIETGNGIRMRLEIRIGKSRLEIRIGRLRLKPRIERLETNKNFRNGRRRIKIGIR